MTASGYKIGIPGPYINVTKTTFKTSAYFTGTSCSKPL